MKRVQGGLHSQRPPSLEEFNARNTQRSRPLRPTPWPAITDFEPAPHHKVRANAERGRVVPAGREGDARRFSRRLGTMLNEYRLDLGCGVRELCDRLPPLWSPSTLGRLLGGEADFDFDGAVAATGFLARKLRVPAQGLLGYLLDAPPRGAAAEDLYDKASRLEAATHWRLGAGRLAGLAGLLERGQRKAGSLWLSGRWAHAFLLPDALRRRLHRHEPQFGGARTSVWRTLDRWGGELQERHLRSGASPATLLVAEGQLRRAARAVASMGPAGGEQWDQLLENFADAVAGRGLMIGVVEDLSPRAPAALLAHFASFEEVRLGGADFLARRPAEGLTFEVFERDRHPLGARHIEAEGARLRQLAAHARRFDQPAQLLERMREFRA